MKRTNTIKKVLVIVIAALMLSSLVVTSNASDDNHSYAFYVPAHQGISQYSNGNYRSTNDTNNAWKVNLKASSEPGNGNTYTSFCLGNSSQNAVSGWHNVQEASGSHYYAAYTSASNITVYLQAKDNNNIANSYNVSGVWDEETGQLPD